MKSPVILITLILFTVFQASAFKISNGEELVKAMHEKYSGKWYKTLTFVQKNTRYRPDGTTQNSVWYEAMSVPGKLRVDFAPIESGNGMMFVDGKQVSFSGNKLVRSRPRIHSLMTLGFDVYGQPVKETLRQLREVGFDLALLREDTWQERPVYVVGARKEDLRTSQFWIDREHLYFVRLLQPAGADQKSTQETRFNKYRKVGGGWVAPEVVFIVNGKRVFLEEYTDIQTGVKLESDLFVPEKWAEVETDYFKIS